MTNDSDPGDWINTKEAAELTGYSVQYIRQLIRQEKIIAKKWLRDWAISRLSLLKYRRMMKIRGRAKHTR